MCWCWLSFFAGIVAGTVALLVPSILVLVYCILAAPLYIEDSDGNVQIQ